MKKLFKILDDSVITALQTKFRKKKKKKKSDQTL